MRHELVDFKTFREEYMSNAEGGYYSVYSVIKEDDFGNKVVKMDMICNWRLTDGKVKFIAVPFETKEELNEITTYLRLCAGYLNTSILEQIDELVI
jgi:hypothetical protein